MIRWIPRLLLITAVLHTLLGLVRGLPVFRAIIGDGVINTVAGHDDRMSVIWFLLTGFALFALADLARWTVRETGRIPARLGGWLVGLAVPGIVLMPVSGFWLLAVIGILGLVSAGRTRPHVSESSLPDPLTG